LKENSTRVILELIPAHGPDRQFHINLVIIFVCTFCNNEILNDRVIILPFTDVKSAEIVDLLSQLNEKKIIFRRKEKD